MSQHSPTHLGTIDMTTDSITPLVDRNYLYSHAFQWAREAIVNSAQAHATKVHFTTEWQAAKTLGVHRRVIIDNGPGIPREQMKAFLNTFGGSGKTVAAAGQNFGIGLKTSLLPWNTYGVVLISKVSNDEVTMMVLHKDTAKGDHGTYGARLFDVSGEDEKTLPTDTIALEQWNYFHLPEDTDEAVDWTKIIPANQKSGFAIILLGDNPMQDTITGDPKRNENTKYGLEQYINSRFWSMPLAVTVDQYEHYTDKTTWPTAPVGARTQNTAKQGRKPTGLKQVILSNNCKATTRNPERGLDGHGCFEIAQTKTQSGFRIHWWLAKEQPQWRGDIATMPMTGILHTSHEGIEEVYDFAATGVNLTAVNAKTRMNQFVLVGDVAKRLAIIIEPLSSKRFQVYPESSRTKVMFESETSGAQDMPWAEWALAWQQHLPKEVKDAIDAYYADAAEKTQDGESLRDLIDFGTSHAARLHKVSVFASHIPTGTVFGKPATASGKKTPAKKTVTTNAADSTPATSTPPEPTVADINDQQRKRAVNLGLILCVAVAEPDENHVLRFDPSTRQTLLNVSHPMYRNMVDDIVEQYVAKGRLLPTDVARRSLIENIIKAETQKHLTLAGTHAYALAMSNPEEKDQILSPWALQAALYGIRHVESLAAKPIGQRLKSTIVTDSDAA